MTPTPAQIRTLPGSERMLEGLQDWRSGQTTISSCLIAIAFGKFRKAGLGKGEPPFSESELVLYDLLRKQVGNAYGRYNSLLRKLVSFGRALVRFQRNSE